MIGDLLAVLGRWWEDPALTGLHRLPASTLAGQIPDFDDRYVHDLGGAWDFQLLDRPTAPLGDAWQPIRVPGCWTTQGFGDRPQYTNVVMPFAGDPPYVPDRNPTGVYRTTFRRPAGWADRRTILNVGSAESCAAVWCNGTFAGIASDSRLPSEFDLTAHVRAGANELVVMVVRWSAHTWMEDQDHWYHAGLERRVYLRSVPPVSLADVRLTPHLAGDGSATLAVDARVDWGARLADPPPGWSVRVRLGRRAAIAPVSLLDATSHVAAHVDAYRHPGPRAAVTLAVPRVEAWSHESPRRYRVTVELRDPSGAVAHTYSAQVGFRSVEVRGAELLLNGVPLLIAGVNRHDHHPTNGKTLTDDELRADVGNIKRCGFNAVRTSHYPPDPVVLDACDELGLWVLLEANVETHARTRELAHDPRFEHQYVERVQRAVATHWNHPSIVGWSLGNEAGYGAVHDAAAAWVRRTDPSRFVQYEGCLMDRWRDGAFVPEWATAATDIECPMYPPVGNLIRWATETTPDRPLILCEYSHAMGNSNGGLADYWNAFERYHGLQGGFVWDWKDQAFALTDADGRRFWGYGGSWGDDPHDSVFCDNGMVNADGVPRPAVEEHRWLTRPVRTTFAGDALTITNRRAFTTIADLRAEVSAGAKVVRRLRLDLAPGESTRVDAPGADTIRWTDKSGQIVAWDQGPRAVVVSLRRSSVRATGSTTEAARSPVVELVETTPPVLTLWRAPTDNDGIQAGPFAGMARPLRWWRRWGLDTQPPEQLGVVHRRTAMRLPDGGVRYDEDVRIPPELNDVPRVGVYFSVPAEYANLRWRGRGPWETMPDRRHAPIGTWSSTVAEQLVDYPWPQHHGSHIDTDWFELTDARGRGVRCQLGGLTFDVSAYSAEALTAARTLAELRPDGRTHVHIDAALRGAGTAACGPDTDVIVGPGRYRFSWSIHPLGR